MLNYAEECVVTSQIRDRIVDHMLHEPDDVQIRLVAQGLMTLMGRNGAVAELTRLYGRERSIQAMRRSTVANRYGDRPEDVDLAVDLADEPHPVTIDLRDGHVPSARPVRTHRAAAVYTHGSYASRRAKVSAGRTYYL